MDGRSITPKDTTERAREMPEWEWKSVWKVIGEKREKREERGKQREGVCTGRTCLLELQKMLFSDDLQFCVGFGLTFTFTRSYGCTPP